MSADETQAAEQRGEERMSDDAGWEAKVVNRLRSRMEELSRQLGESVDTCHFSWETRTLEVLRERLQAIEGSDAS